MILDGLSEKVIFKGRIEGVNGIAMLTGRKDYFKN